MSFQKGVVTNPNGRPKGAVNRKTRFEKALSDFDHTHASKMLMLFYEEGLKGDIAAGKVFLEYVLPKADKRVELDIERERKDFSHLSGEQIREALAIIRPTENAV